MKLMPDCAAIKAVVTATGLKIIGSDNRWFSKNRDIPARSVAYGLWVCGLAATFHRIFSAWIALCWKYDHYSHLLIIPLISATILCLRRRTIFQSVSAAPLAAAVCALAGTALLVGRRLAPLLNENDFIAIGMAGVLSLVLAGFIALFGSTATRKAAFPLGFLVLAVPVPLFVLDGFIEALRYGSSAVASCAFDVVGVPVLREGFIFRLPGLSIEVAKECSGIRSSMALLVLATLSAHFFLRTPSRRALLVALSVPLLVLKNGVRIATLTLLARFVSPSFLTGSLHRNGGIVFFAFALAIFALLLRVLERSEPPVPLAQAKNMSPMPQSS
jgi:exosortase